MHFYNAWLEKPFHGPTGLLLTNLKKKLKKKFHFFFFHSFLSNSSCIFEACIAFLSRVTGKTFPWPCWSPFDNFFLKQKNMESFFSHVTWKGFSCYEDPLINLYGMYVPNNNLYTLSSTNFVPQIHHWQKRERPQNGHTY